MADLQKSFKACSLLSVRLVVLVLWMNMTERSCMAATELVEVGAILDMNSTLGQIVSKSLVLAIEDYYKAYNQTVTKIKLTVDHVSQNDAITAASKAYDLMVNKKMKAVLGPQNPEQARYIVKLGEQKNVPVIWFPITGPSLLPPPSPSYIYIGQDPICYQFKAIAATIEALGWQSIVPIYEETEYGSHLVPCLTKVLKEMNIRMANVTAIVSNFTDVENINRTLVKLKDMRTHVFLVHMSVDFGREFIQFANREEMMGEGYAWIVTQELSSLTDPQVSVERNLYLAGELYDTFTDLISLKGYMPGALGVRPTETEKTNLSWFRSNLTIYGQWAYHTIEALAMALEKQGTNNINGQTLRSQIRATNFKGDSGINFDLRKGQLEQSELDVYNVISKRERILGSWSPKTGLVRNFSEGGGDETAGYQLRDPLWPGDTLDKPPKLRIGVPRTNSFPEFVNVDDSNKLRFDGFAISVFLKAIDVLPFPLNNYEFVPLPKESGSPMMNFDDILCKQMKDENLDAIVGDITIVAHRTKCVDFTLPYLDSSVAMVVRVKKVSTSRGILFKPFKWSLWLILGGIFVAATIIIIILEKSKSKRNASNKVDEFLINPFLVYKMDVMEKFASSAAGWMVILTSFLFILILQVYTANLTSILTQGHIKEPLFRNENETISRNIPVGYRSGSWVKGFLINQIGLNSSQLRPLGSREEYNYSLSNGVVQAIFDETPYLTLFLSKYKSSFMLAGPIYKTGGFAFAFPKKSSLGSHFSNAILKVTQDAEPYRVMMAKSFLPTSIEDLEFEDESDVKTSSLTIDKFKGLYPVLLSVVALFLCLSIPSVIEGLRNPSSVIEWLRNKKQLIFS